MADRIVVMRDGTPLDICDRPATTFVAGFTGIPAMNLLKGHLFSAATSRRLAEAEL
ncbi:hypothetical protein [Rhizobium etli]|uniref:ABC-type sugar transport system ATPase subunit n=1 Tax=Rhizobium etli TaxID=29449 RepID=A0A7W6ZLZ9_RHIET|nr:ABC-type sugar transport system ATPase subunit [Rhizobium etli]MBB4538585.1 ABC-type sugar transport system ATPase subunit [Rhizobium etli]